MDEMFKNSKNEITKMTQVKRSCKIYSGSYEKEFKPYLQRRLGNSNLFPKSTIGFGKELNIHQQQNRYILDKRMPYFNENEQIELYAIIEMHLSMLNPKNPKNHHNKKNQPNMILRSTNRILHSSKIRIIELESSKQFGIGIQADM